jgi:hypothetical protein
MTKNASNQLTFVWRYQDHIYHITVGSDIPADELIELVSNYLEMQPTKRSR